MLLVTLNKIRYNCQHLVAGLGIEIMNKLDIDKAFVSDYDRFLFEFDVAHEKSPSQLTEITKHQRIAKLRDHSQSGDDQEKLWESF